MTKRQNNKKTKIGCVVFVGAKPDSPDVAPKLGVIVAKTKKPWLSIDPRFARPGEQPSDRNLSHPDELVRSHVPGAAQLPPLSLLLKAHSSSDPDPCVQIGYVDLRSLSGGVHDKDVPPNFALPFKDWLGRVFRVHSESASVRRAIVAACEAQAVADGSSAETVWRRAWEHDRDHKGPAPEYPRRMEVVLAEASRTKRKSRLMYRLQSVIR